MRKILSLFLTVLLMLSLVTTVFAASSEAIDAANALYQLGLFAGVGTNADGSPNFDLDRTMTRAEAVTMLVRLLNKEADAQAASWTTPFTDVAEWAKPYVGYAYTNSLTGGTSATTFSGSQEVSATQYLTFVLRALGYDGNDFAWDKAWELTNQLGITHGQYDANSDFTRGDAAIVSYAALSANKKGQSTTLLNSLGLGAKKVETITVDSVNISGRDYLMVGKSTQLTASIYPADANAGDVNWYILAITPDVANMTRGGVLTALKPGYVIVWAETDYHVTSEDKTIYIKGRSPVMVKNESSRTDSVGGTTFTFDLVNNGDKIIKYVTLRWKCLNAVGDALYDTISWSDTFSVRVTGPLAPGQTMERISNSRPFYNRDFAYHISIVEYVIDYMDGSVEVVTPDKYIGYWEGVG